MSPYYSGGTFPDGEDSNHNPLQGHTVIDAGGGSHEMLGVVSPAGVQTGMYESFDGSGISYSYGNGFSFVDRNGIQYKGGCMYWSASPCPNGTVFMVDPSGNSVVSTTGGLTDSIGRSIPVFSNQRALNTIAKCETQQYPVVGGTTAPIDICWQQLTATSSFGTNREGTKTYVAITGITLQNGTSWNFSYDNFGCLSSITTPTGAVMTYVYYPPSTTQYPMGENQGERFLQSRTLTVNGNKYKWQYAYTLITVPGNGTESQTTVTDPVGNTVIHLFNGYGLETLTQYFQGTQTLLKAVQYTYYAGPIPGVSNHLPKLTTTTLYPSGQSTTTCVIYDNNTNTSCTGTDAPSPSGLKVYDPNDALRNIPGFTPYSAPLVLGSPMYSYEYDYTTGSSPGTLLRETANTYQWQANDSYRAANLLNLVSSSSISAGGAVLSTTTRNYDEGAYGPAGVYGNATTQVDGGSVTTHAYYNSSGMSTGTKDGNGNTTTIDYDATGAYPKTITKPPTNVAHSDDYVYDANTGLMMSHTDENHQPTTYGYDNMRRPTSVGYPDGGHETYVYNDTAPSPTITSTKALTATSSYQTIVTADALGRQVRNELVSDPNGPIFTDTTYDGVGNIQSVSNPYRSTSDSTYGVTVFGYDVLGRKTVQTQPDRSTQQWSYPGNGTTFTDEARQSWSRTSDALGRLTSVSEPTGASTGYVYDALSNLRTVNQNGVSGDTARVRSFSYDSLSRLITASNPETGTVCYGYWSGSNCINGYDANGNLANKTDARGISTNYSYDALNRITNKSSSGAAGVPGLNYVYMYDQVSVGGSFTSSNPVGRLVFASNNVNADRHYSYDAMGRVIHQDGCIPSNCVVGASPVYASYDLAGNMTSLTFPDRRTISQSNDAAGRLSSITYTGWNGNGHTTPYLSTNGSAEYDPANHLINATMGNGVGIAAAYDNRERVNLLAYGTSNQLLWGKQYEWTPNNNLQAITDASSGVQRWMVYDNLNRLSSAQDLIGPQQGANTSPYPSIPGGWTGSNSGTVAAVPFWTDPDESNLIDNADTPGASGWEIANASIASGIAAPDGTASAYTFTASSGSTDTYLGASVSSQSLFDGESMVGSVWLRSPSGSQTVNLYLVEIGSAGYAIQGYKPVTVTQNWQQFQVTGQFQYGHQGLILQIGGAKSITSGQAISIWGTKLEDAGTTGPTITNFLPYSQRLTASTWAFENGSAIDNSATAPDGSQTAATVTANSGSSAGWFVDTIPNPAPYSGVAITGSVWLRSTVGPQQLLVTLINVSAQTGYSTLGATTVTLSNDWQRFHITGTNASALTGLEFQIGGGSTFTNGQSFQVWGAQVEFGSTANVYVATAANPVSTGTNLTNVLPYSQQPNAPSWSGTVGGSGVMNAVVAPDSSQTGYQFTAVGGNGWLTNDVTNPAIYDNAILTGSIFLRSPNGAESVNIYLIGQNASGRVLFQQTTAQLTSTWQRFSLTGQAPNGLTRLFIQIGDTLPAGEVIDVWGSQMELSSAAGPYVVTSQLPVVAGKELSNILSSSQQISGPGWAIANGTVTAYNGVAPDGTNTAATITASSPETFIDNNVANPSLYDGQTVTASVYLKVPSGTLNTNLYLINSGASGFMAPYVVASITTSWQRFSITTQVQNGLTQLALQIGGGGSFTSGSIQIWGAQMVLGSDAAPYMDTSSTTTNPVNGQAATPVPNGLNQSYLYDSFGNLQQNGSFNDSATANNQMFGYAYDAAGNLLSNGLTTMSWDAESKLIST
ncbi:hypothetical protein, partial [Granulicella sp. S190]|uniref:phage head spike fiber domain-containing protein n=1 Tax=Granulicella sp. S190 TaxID=1747226 RepID=UPI001C201A76